MSQSESTVMVVTSTSTSVQLESNSAPVTSAPDLSPSPTTTITTSTDSLCMEPKLIPVTQDCVDNNDDKVKMNGASSLVAAKSLVVASVMSKDSGLIADVDGRDDASSRDGASTLVKCSNVTLMPLAQLLCPSSASSSPSRDSTSSKLRGSSTLPRTEVSPAKSPKSRTRSLTPRKSPKPSTSTKSVTPLKFSTAPKSSTSEKWLTASEFLPWTPRQRRLTEMFSRSSAAVPQASSTSAEFFSASSQPVAVDGSTESNSSSADRLRIADPQILVEDSQADTGSTSLVCVVVDTQESMFVDDTPPKCSDAVVTIAAATADDVDDFGGEGGFSELQQTIVHVDTDTAEQQLTTAALNVDVVASTHSREPIFQDAEDLMSELDVVSSEAQCVTKHSDVASNTVSTITAASCETVDHTQSIASDHTQSAVVDLHTKPDNVEYTQPAVGHTEDVVMDTQPITQHCADHTQETAIDHTQAVNHTQDFVIDDMQVITSDPSQSIVDHTQETAMDCARDTVIDHTLDSTQQSLDHTQEIVVSHTQVVDRTGDNVIDDTLCSVDHTQEAVVIDHTQAGVGDNDEGNTMDPGENVAVMATSDADDNVTLREVMRSSYDAADSFLSSPDVPLTHLRASQRDDDVDLKRSASGPSHCHGNGAEDANKFLSSDDDVPLTHLRTSQEALDDEVGSRHSGPLRRHGNRKDAMHTTLQGRVSRHSVETRPTRINLRTRSVRRVTTDLVNLGAKKSDVRQKERQVRSKRHESAELKKAVSSSRPLPHRPKRSCRSAWMRVAPMLSKDDEESGSQKKNQHDTDVGRVADDKVNDARMTSPVETSDDLELDFVKAGSGEELAKNFQAKEVSFGAEEPTDDVEHEEQVDSISVMPTPDSEVLLPVFCGELESGQETINTVEKSAVEAEVHGVNLNCVIRVAQSCEMFVRETVGKPETGQKRESSVEKSDDDAENIEEIALDLISAVKPTDSGEVLHPELCDKPKSGHDTVNADKVDELITMIGDKEACSSGLSSSVIVAEDSETSTLTTNAITTNTDSNTVEIEFLSDGAAFPISVPYSSEVVVSGNNKDIFEAQMEVKKSTPVSEASGEYQWKVPMSSSMTRGSQATDALPETPTSVPRRRFTSRGSLMLERAKQLRQSVVTASPPSKKSSVVEQSSEEDLVSRSPSSVVGHASSSGLSKLRVFSPAASPSASILRKRQLSTDSATSSGQSPTSPSSGRVS